MCLDDGEHYKGGVFWGKPDERTKERYRAKKLIYIALVPLLFCILEFTFLPNSFHAMQYLSQDFHYSLTMPDSWIQIPQDIMEEAKKTISTSEKAEAIQYEVGFQKDDTEYYFTYPYVLINSFKSRQPSEAELKEFAGLNTNDWNNLVREYDLDEVIEEQRPLEGYYSEADHAVLVSNKMNIEGVGNIVCFMMAFAGREECVSINYYCLEDNVNEESVAFNKLAKSFSFDEGYEYQVKSASASERVVTKVLSWAFIIVLFLVINVIWSNFRRKKADVDS